MNGYIAYYNQRRIEVYAETSYRAQQDAVARFRAPKSKRHLVHVVLVEQDGKPVTHTTSEI